MMTHPALSPHTMLRSAVVAIALSITPPAAAESTQYEVGLCRIVTQVAEQAMTKRQHGTPKHQLIQATFGLCDAAPFDDCYTFTALARSIVRQAYTVPDYHTPENEDIAIASFAAEWQVFCADTLYKD